MRHSTLVLLAAAALSAPLAAQTPARVMGAPYHDPSRAFIDLMTPHHQMAVMMTEHHMPMFKSDSVRSLARRMLDSQKREIAELKEARRALFGADSTREPAMGHMMQMMARMHGDSQPGHARDSAMRMHQGPPPPTPRPLPSMSRTPQGTMSHMMTGDMDRMFLEHMIRHHQEGADLAVLAEDSQAAARVKQLAQKIRRSQEQDIADLRRLLARLPAPAAPAHRH